MTLKIGVDWTNKGWVELHRAAGDAGNLFGGAAANWYGSLFRASASGTVSTSFAAWQFADNATKYGASGSQLTFDATERYAIGWDGSSNYNVTGQAAGTYTGSVFVRRISGTSPQFRLLLKSSGGTTVTGATQTLSGSATTIYQLTASGSLPHAAQSIRLEVECLSGSSGSVFVFGPMIVAGPSAPEYLNCGADGQHDNITRYVRSARWRTGFVQPYQYVAGAGHCTIHLNNQDKRFSPEFVGGPNYGNFISDRFVQIADDFDVLWTGYVDAWTPQHGTKTSRYATMEASDGFKFIRDTEIFPDLQTDATPSALIDHIVSKVENAARATLYYGWGVSYSGQSTDFVNLETETVPYFFDRVGDEKDGNGQSPRALLGAILEGVQGKFWFTRFGYATYGGPNEDGGAVAATFDNTAMGIVYEYGQGIVNACTVRYYPRELPLVNVNLYDMHEPLEVAAGQTETFRAYYRFKETDERVGAVASSVVLAGLSYSGGGLVASIVDVDAQSCQIDVVSSSGSTRTLLTLRVRGDALRAWDPGSRTWEDGDSVELHGRRGERINSNWVEKGPWAKKLAWFRVTRLKDARGEVLSLSGKYGKDPQFAECWIGRKIRVIDDQLDHDGTYIVIGEDHQWSKGNNHDVRLYLEPATTLRVSLMGS